MTAPESEDGEPSNVELMLDKLKEGGLARALILTARGKEGEEREAALRECLETRRLAIRKSLNEEGLGEY